MISERDYIKIVQTARGDTVDATEREINDDVSLDDSSVDSEINVQGGASDSESDEDSHVVALQRMEKGTSTRSTVTPKIYEDFIA